MGFVLSHKHMGGGQTQGSVLYRISDAISGKSLMVCCVSKEESSEFENRFKSEKQEICSHFGVQDASCIRMELV